MASRALGALAAALVALPTTAAQAVTVSPTAVYISAKSPSALLTLINTGSRPEEIELSIGFGYPVSDSAGVLHVDIVDSAAAPGSPRSHPIFASFRAGSCCSPASVRSFASWSRCPPGLATVNTGAGCW